MQIWSARVSIGSWGSRKLTEGLWPQVNFSGMILHNRSTKFRTPPRQQRGRLELLDGCQGRTLPACEMLGTSFALGKSRVFLSGSGVMVAGRWALARVNFFVMNPKTEPPSSETASGSPGAPGAAQWWSWACFLRVWNAGNEFCPWKIFDFWRHMLAVEFCLSAL